MKEFFTIERDLEIVKQPFLNLNRYYKFLRFLTKKDLNKIEKYIFSKGKDAYLEFSKKKGKKSLVSIISLQEKYSKDKYAIKPLKREEIEKNQEKKILDKIEKSPVKLIKKRGTRK